MIHPVDLHVGKKIRYSRRIVGMTQEDLAKEVGVKFQQIQKYETGANRVSASRLWDISKALEVSVEFFFSGLEEETIRPSRQTKVFPVDTIEEKETIELIRSYYTMSKNLRIIILDLLRSIAPGA